MKWYHIFLLIVIIIITLGITLVIRKNKQYNKIKKELYNYIKISDKKLSNVVVGKKKKLGKITTLITTSPIPCMNSIKIIRQTIDSLSMIKSLLDEQVIICFDGGVVDPIQNINSKCTNLNDDISLLKYKLYKNNVKIYALENLPYVSFSELPVRGCLTKNLHNSFSNINTKYINVMQHDLPIIKHFDVDELLNAMEHDPEIKLVRYVYNSNKYHENYTKKCFNENSIYTKLVTNIEKKYNNITLSTCSQWSDNNHITTVDYYTNIVFPKTLYKKSFMENTLDCLPIKDHSLYGTWYLGNINDGYYIKHIDGRYC
jgi:hypothetical protein